MKKLIDYTEKFIYRGVKFRCKGAYPYEETVDFLLCDLGGEFGLIVCTGYKSGLIFCIFPAEALTKEKGIFALDTQWLKENWKNWGYAAIEEVCIIEN